LVTHQVATAFERGWSTLQNGALLNVAEQADFDLLISTDQSMRYQQNLSKRKIALLILLDTNWRQVRTKVDVICQAVDAIQPGDYVEVPI
jgi:hypothetical protein